MKFEQTNRLIFIGVRFNKLPLYSLSCEKFSNLVEYCDEHNKYISSMTIFKSLTIDPSQIMEVEVDDDGEKETILYEFNYLKLFHHITTLAIKMFEWWDLRILWAHLFEVEPTNLQNLKSLRIVSNEIYQPPKNLFQIRKLTNHTTLEYFEISAGFLCKDYMNTCDYKFISSLKGFAINNFCVIDEDTDCMMVNICKSFGDNLESLHKGNNLQIENTITGKLNQLQEFCFSLHSETLKGDEIDEIAILLNENMNKLKRIYFGNFGVAGKAIQKQSMELFLNKIIQNVCYIGLSMDSQHNAFKMDSLLMQMDILIKSLTSVRKNKFKIRMD
eukprot:183154_1